MSIGSALAQEVFNKVLRKESASCFARLGWEPFVKYSLGRLFCILPTKLIFPARALSLTLSADATGRVLTFFFFALSSLFLAFALRSTLAKLHAAHHARSLAVACQEVERSHHQIASSSQTQLAPPRANRLREMMKKCVCVAIFWTLTRSNASLS